MYDISDPTKVDLTSNLLLNQNFVHILPPVTDNI